MATLFSPNFRSSLATRVSPDAYSAGRLLRFSALGIPIAAAELPIGVYVPALFGKLYGLSLASIGVIFLIGRLWDGLLDPIFGALSDRTRGRFGRRRPWIVGGGLLFFACTVLLFFPVATVTPTYLAITLLFFYVAWTAVQIPYLAWSGELCADYHQRTRVATYQTVVTSAGLFIALVLPAIAEKLRPGDARLQLTLMGGLLLATIIPTLFLSLTAVPEPDAPIQTEERFSPRQAIGAVFANPLLMRVLLSDVAVTLGQAVRGALIVFFVGFYMGRPDWAATLFLFQFVFGILAGPIWGHIGRRIGKSQAAVAGEIVQALINLALLAVTPDRFGLLLALTLAQGLTQGSGNLMLRAIVADIADKQRLDTGEERSGLYYSVFTLSRKLGGAAAIGIALPLVAWFGFNPKGGNTPEALQGLLYVFALGPAIAHTISAFLVARFPLDQTAHSEIRRRLDAGFLTLAPAE